MFVNPKYHLIEFNGRDSSSEESQKSPLKHLNLFDFRHSPNHEKRFIEDRVSTLRKFSHEKKDRFCS